MGYPNSVIAFTTKQDGVNYPQAADINGPQTEITAVESGLLNGFQHPITVAVGGVTQSASTGSNNFTGPSTLASLSVTGGSTFAGPVTFTGAVAFPRTLFAQVSQTGTVPVADSVWTGINFDNNAQDAGGLHSTAVNSSRINLTSAGAWEFFGQTEWNGGVVGAIKSRIVINDVIAIGAQGQPNDGTGPQPAQVRGFYVTASTTDYVTLRVLQVSGSTRSITPSTTYGGTFLVAQRVSA
jgi:hypothetical protein